MTVRTANYTVCNKRQIVTLSRRLHLVPHRMGANANKSPHWLLLSHICTCTNWWNRIQTKSWCPTWSTTKQLRSRGLEVCTKLHFCLRTISVERKCSKFLMCFCPCRSISILKLHVENNIIWTSQNEIKISIYTKITLASYVWRIWTPQSQVWEIHPIYISTLRKIFQKNT